MLQIISKSESSSSISTSRRLSLTTSDIPVEIPTTHNNERAHDNIMETVHLDIVQSILITIVKNIIKDDNKAAIENNSLLDTSKVKKTSELIDEFTDIVIADAAIIDLINKDQNNDSNTNEIKDLLESASNGNGTELRNKRFVHTSSDSASGFDITNINETITESENKFDSEDMNKLSSTLSESENKANELMTDKDKHKQTSDIFMQNLDIENTV